ncbi:hypothetical protein HBB16_00160 [Pseudonocardia sp. MCCB 268]|nr:hypothetical protein [Pseudonocardia cytotoxica]
MDLLVLPTARRLRRTHPRLEVRITQVESAEAFPRLLTEQLDLAVTLPTRTGPSVDGTHEQVHLLDDPLRPDRPRRPSLAGQAGATLDDVAHEPWVLAAPRQLRPARPRHRRLPHRQFSPGSPTR